MRLPRVRFTVQRIMVAVAIIAIAFGGFLLRRRALSCQALATSYAGFEVGCDRMKALIQESLRVLDEGGGGEAELQAARNLEGELIIRKVGFQGKPLSDEMTARRFAKTFSSERLADLKKLGREEIVFYDEVAKTHRQNRLSYDYVARYPWLSLPPTVPLPR